MATIPEDEVREGSLIDCPIQGIVYEDFREKPPYECRVLVCREEDGTFYARALRLPGVFGQGDSIDDAVEDIKEAFAGAISVYLDDGVGIPWIGISDIDEERPQGSVEKWVLVNA